MTRRLVVSLVAIVLLAGGAFGANLVAGNHPALGLDLQGGASVTMTPVGEVDPAALDAAIVIIKGRIDNLGVAEPEIVRQGDTVIVNLPGVKDQKEALDTIGKQGAVEMRPVLQVVENPENTTSTTVVGGPTTTVKPASTTLPPPAGGVGSSRTAVATTTTVPLAAEPVDPLTGLPEGQTSLPGDKDGLLYLLGPVAATGEVFSSESKAEVIAGAWGVNAELRSGAAGADVWNALATTCFAGGADCPTKAIAIILDGKVISAPTVQAEKFDNGVNITGNFTESEANYLARVLKFGAVPVQFDISTVQTVSASLGKDSLRAALLSGLIGVLLVLLFMLFYYRLLAIVVVGGLSVSGLLLWSVISLISKYEGLALTLSGAAGIIVSVGVTVDSYVVFFEKLKDDIQLGRTLRNSAARGFERAWRTILVADTVSLIGAAVLWKFTEGSVKGFAFFLGLSTMADMIVSYFFTRPAVLLLAKTKLFNKGRVLGVAKTKISEAVV